MKKRNLFSLALIVLLTLPLFLTACAKVDSNKKLDFAFSADGEPIAYSVRGKGEVTLVFIHGWSCDSRYWRKQIPFFEKKYQVVTIDLAGHGHSGMDRKIYRLENFAEDVQAVINKINAQKVILIGHSMGGGIIGKTATLLPKKVIGLIAIDALQNVEEPMPAEEINAYMTAFKNDFRQTVRSFVNEMLVSNMDSDLREWVINDMSAAPSQVGISAFYEFITTFQNNGMAKIFEEVTVPIRCINSDLWPTNEEVNKRHMKSFKIIVMKGLGHFIMLESPLKFNQNLENVIEELVKLNTQQINTNA